ncbi:helix-turn-helix domain-containing protein [Nonomuraea candida]|uniref:helix-turn-helix domain-containing protein n=1 Tax=Nonomuraea candida TaxID=359159 RepID=UPI0012FA73CD|nr:helix-turn-helix transcriptional regulator [Nonomuraea candida]
MGDDVTFGQLLRRLRGERSLSAIGHLANISKGHLHDLENGRRSPSRSVAAKLDEVLRADGRLIAGYKNQREFRPDGDDQTCPRPAEVKTLRQTGEEDTDRRRLLSLAAGVGLGFGCNESVRRMIDVVTPAYRSVEEWNTAQADHLHALRTRPPAQVAADLAIDLHDLALHLQQAAPADLPDLYRTAALLSCIQANALTRLADHGAAIRAGKQPHLNFLTVEAKALSMLGRHQEAAEKLKLLTDLTETSEADRWGFWKEDQIYFAASWVHAAAGRTELAGDARDQVLRLAGDYQYRANVKLHETLCVVRLGGVDEGMRRATEVVAALPVQHRSAHIKETARIVLRAVPPEQRARPSVVELRTLLATGA